MSTFLLIAVLQIVSIKDFTFETKLRLEAVLHATERLNDFFPWSHDYIEALGRGLTPEEATHAADILRWKREKFQ